MCPARKSVLRQDAKGVAAAVLNHCDSSAGSGGSGGWAVTRSHRPSGYPARNRWQEITTTKATIVVDSPIVGSVKFEEGDVVPTGRAEWLSHRVDWIDSSRIA